MNSGPLPPLPDLIPITALRKNDSSSSSKPWDCAPCTTYSEVMGEQRSRRTGKQPAIDLIDTVQSRGSSAAPQAPSRKARSERHRKSDRRREYKGGRRRSSSKQRSRSRASSPEKPANPRVNPIFVWVRQEDTHIVDVKCEDYDKRNRILLTKTAQGWRAIPRTESWTPSLKEAAADQTKQHHRKSRKAGRVKRKSTAVQVDEDIVAENTDDDKSIPLDSAAATASAAASPTWTSPVNIESHLPSHKIQVLKTQSPPPPPEPEVVDEPNLSVNSDVNYSAQTQGVKCNTNKICDVSPLDNLLAVAELEFNHQIQTGEWNKTTDTETTTENTETTNAMKQYTEINDEQQKEYLDNFEHLNKLIESCSNNNNDSDDHNDFAVQNKPEDCDYNEEDDNNLAMDDILSRLEQSLRSPETCKEINDMLGECDNSIDTKLTNINETNSEICTINNNNNNNFNDVPELESYLVNEDNLNCKNCINDDDKTEAVVESSTATVINQDVPTDLSIKKSNYEIVDSMEPTDLSIPKSRKSPTRTLTPRPPSQNSETIQSPQPSGIPAVPPSPDLINTSKSKPVFLETLLTTSNQKLNLNSEVTIIRQKEPLDLGKCRKSASPTVTCSEEVKNNVCSSEAEPMTKKFKFDEANLKSMLDIQTIKVVKETEKKKSRNNEVTQETPKLLELLTSDTEPDALTQLKQVLSDPVINVPDPMLIPKDKLSSILSLPGKEIPKLLKQRPELRLPEALAFPHLLQDPDILVITLSQLETIIQKQSQPIPLKDVCRSEEVHEKKTTHSERVKDTSLKTSAITEEAQMTYPTQSKDNHVKNNCINELASDIDAATNSALSQMMWLPYLNQLEAAMSFTNNADLLKVLSNAFPLYPGQMNTEMMHMFGNNRLPKTLNLPLQTQNYSNPLEFSMWQEAMMQANLLRSKNAFETFNAKNTYREYMEKMTASTTRKTNHNHKQHHQPVKPNPPIPNTFYPANMQPYQTLHNPFMNIPSNYQAPPPVSAKHNLQIPQYNPLFAQKSQSSKTAVPSKSQNYNKYDTGMAKMSSNMYYQKAEEQRKAATQQSNYRLDPSSSSQKQKVSCKSFAHVPFQKTDDVSKNNCVPELSRHFTTQPMDLSDSTSLTNKYNNKVKQQQHLVDAKNSQKLHKHDEIPEVGSTTASIEEMQDAQKHLWHPLFGNQKNYNNPWNWSSVAATGE